MDCPDQAIVHLGSAEATVTLCGCSHQAVLAGAVKKGAHRGDNARPPGTTRDHKVSRGICLRRDWLQYVEPNTKKAA